MVNREDNELLTRVEHGAPMGELMRRYWVPVPLGGPRGGRSSTPDPALRVSGW